jgi:hypothetical protein
MITTSNSSSYEEERDAQSITRCFTAHHRNFGLSRVRTELDPLLMVPSLEHHPPKLDNEAVSDT